MKYPRVAIMTLSDNSFFINVPLVGREMRDFNRELSDMFRKRGESSGKIKKNDMTFLSVLTQLNKEEIETISNQTVRNILTRRMTCR